MLRNILASDTPIIDEWITLDPAHSARGMTAKFFHQPDSLSFAIEDARGPVMFVRIDPLDACSVRMHIQFDERERRRTVLALARAFPDVRERLHDSGTRYVFFDSVSEPLIRFCEKRFGFVRLADSDTYYLFLPIS